MPKRLFSAFFLMTTPLFGSHNLDDNSDRKSPIHQNSSVHRIEDDLLMYNFFSPPVDEITTLLKGEPLNHPIAGIHFRTINMQQDIDAIAKILSILPEPFEKIQIQGGLTDHFHPAYKKLDYKPLFDILREKKPQAFTFHLINVLSEEFIKRVISTGIPSIHISCAMLSSAQPLDISWEFLGQNEAALKKLTFENIVDHQRFNEYSMVIDIPNAGIPIFTKRSLQELVEFKSKHGVL